MSIAPHEDLPPPLTEQHYVFSFTEQTPEALVAAVRQQRQAGDESGASAAWPYLYGHVKRRVSALARRTWYVQQLPPQERGTVVDDIVQNVALKVWEETAQPSRYEDNFNLILYGKTRDQIKAIGRKEGYYAKPGQRTNAVPQVLQDSLDDILEGKDGSDDILRADILPDPRSQDENLLSEWKITLEGRVSQRALDVVACYLLGGYTKKSEIARALGLERVQVYRALDEIRAELERLPQTPTAKTKRRRKEGFHDDQV